MLIVDSVVAPRLERGNKAEKAAEKVQKWVEEQTANAIYLKDNDLSPANAERQLGQLMTSADLEKRLTKLNPNFHFEVNSFNPSKKALFHVRRGEGKVFVCAYENGFMPEHSIIKVKEEVVRDFNMVPAYKGKIDRKDLPRYEVTPDGVKWEDDLPFGFKKVLVPWGEYMRGWRTVTIKLVEAKLTTPTEVERIFGADNRPEWAAHLGKQNITLPW